MRTETSLGVGMLLALQLITSFGAIGLLSRISPATDQILQENVYSLEAVEEMLALLALPDADPARFSAALARAEANITEESEALPLAILRSQHPGALRGDRAARQQTLQALQEVSAINRASMQAASQEAQRLGTSGAWAAAMLGFCSFLWSVQVYRRLRLRLEGPILAIDGVLRATHNGDSHRRCLHLEGPEEVIRIGHNLNILLDQARCPFPEESVEERRALLTVLDQLPTAALLCHPERGTLAANQAALDTPDHPPDHPGWLRSPVPGTDLILLRWPLTPEA